MRTVLQLFPPECVISRASISAKAPVHGEGSLKGKIFYLFEYRGGKDAQYLLRLQQSEKTITHEYTAIRGAARETIVSERVGSPVIFTTTTEGKVFTDDETRFLSTWSDDSSQQTLAIMQSQITGSLSDNTFDLAVWHEAIRLIGRQRCEFHFPQWFSQVPEMVPPDNVRVRRDWERFLTFCKAVALCRSFNCVTPTAKRVRQVTVSFSDYCIAHIIVGTALRES